jgi:glycine dehydrogenase subunit 1
VRIGVSDYAQDQLGDIVFVEMPQTVGDMFEKGEEFGTLESVKAVSELYMPMGGEIVAVNDDPVDGIPKGSTRIPMATGSSRSGPDPAEYDDLMNAEAYRNAEGINHALPAPYPRRNYRDAGRCRQGQPGRPVRRSIPDECRFDGEIPIPAGLSEWQLNDHSGQLAADDSHARSQVLVGAGQLSSPYPGDHPHLTGRSEFLTAYTPYQPEMAQGTLQGIFEYQTLTARLLGMDVANASMYDGASALAEALLMGLRIAKKKAPGGGLRRDPSPLSGRGQAYLQATGFELVELDPSGKRPHRFFRPGSMTTTWRRWPCSPPTSSGWSRIWSGRQRPSTQPGPVRQLLYRTPGLRAAQKSGVSAGPISSAARARVSASPAPSAAPGLGMFACRKEFTRNMPGRLVGETVDLEGRRGFVLTLATREQHIRREKATSNICSNQGICALTAAMYMASLGGSGISQLARLNYDKSEYFKGELQRPGRIWSSFPTFNEFVVRISRDFRPAYRRLLAKRSSPALSSAHSIPNWPAVAICSASPRPGGERRPGHRAGR